MGGWRLFLFLYFGGWIGSRTVLYFLLQHAKNYQTAHLLRAKAVTNYEFVFLALSVFLWSRVRLLSCVPDGVDKKSPVKNKSSWHSVLLAFTLAMNFGTHVSYLTYYIQEWIPFWLLWTLHTLMGFWMHIVFFILAFSFGNFAVRILLRWKLFEKLFNAVPFSKNLRQLVLDSNLQTLVSFALGCAVSLLSIVGAVHLVVREEKVVLSNAVPGATNLRMAILSDIHAGPSVSTLHVERMVQLVNQERPDLVVIIGDLVDGSVAQLESTIASVGQLKSRFGTYFVTGNHEYYYGEADQLMRTLESWNITCLHNKHVMLPSHGGKSGGKVCLAGVDDLSTDYIGLEGHSNHPKKAISGCEKESVIILLMHNPKAIGELSPDMGIDLILAGHIHAAQLYILTPLVYILSEYFHGWYQRNEAKIYVGAGVYYWGTPMKMLGYSDIVMMNIS